jgi:hypothetical protein
MSDIVDILNRLRNDEVMQKAAQDDAAVADAADTSGGGNTIEDKKLEVQTKLEELAAAQTAAASSANLEEGLNSVQATPAGEKMKSVDELPDEEQDANEEVAEALAAAVEGELMALPDEASVKVAGMAILEKVASVASNFREVKKHRELGKIAAESMWVHLDKLANEADGIDVDSLTDDQVDALYDELIG